MIALKKSIYHLLPSNGIGGVEAAAKSTKSLNHRLFTLDVHYLSKKKQSIGFKNNYKVIIPYIKSFYYLFSKEPSVIIASLWRSNLLAILYKLLRRKTKLVLFLHCPNNVHLIDRIVTNISAIIASEVWADSKATLNNRLNNLVLTDKNKKTRVISFITERLIPLPLKKCSPTFIYWGRLSPEKRIDEAISFFHQAYLKNKDCNFTIIGPDCGQKDKLMRLIYKLNLKDNIRIYDSMNIESIRQFSEKASFFLQLSTFEGMGMSVVESMQIGLIPIVTKVGEIKYYCSNSNSIEYTSNSAVLNRVFELIKNENDYQEMRQNAIKTWSKSPIYKEQITNACKELIDEY